MSCTNPAVVKLVQELLLAEPDKTEISPSLIAAKIELVLTLQPRWRTEFDHDAAIDELIRRFSLWVGQDVALQNDLGHVAWLGPQRKRNWRYWQRYREILERRLSFRTVDALDRSTDFTLGFLEDPLRDGSWDRRGLVVGHVQSGKTGHYTGLICKAADAGYKLIIVLAGLHNNLRAQTQMRLDEGFLGFETAPGHDGFRSIGVGEIDGDPSIRPNFATHRAEGGDFNARTAHNMGISPEQRPWLFVVKKNNSVLGALQRWIRDHVAESVEPGTGSPWVERLPLLLIDDEADHASVDTGENVVGEDGVPDDEHQPTAINGAIRRLLRSFSRRAYVGYTATPFANIFIHERGATSAEGPDLFPSSFILNLATPSDYIGPSAVFGLRDPSKEQRGLPLHRGVSDHENAEGTGGWMPRRHKRDHIPGRWGGGALPASLVEAIDAFVLGNAERQIRGAGHEHASMLIHVTRFVAVQSLVLEQVAEHLRGLRQRILRRIDIDPLIRRLRALWERDFLPTNANVRRERPDMLLPPLSSWDAIEVVLPEVVAAIEVRAINGTAKDALDYDRHKETGLKIIAIGGDKLARGLTLEGLSVSYFLRASRMYDTLMQMGRWFGYRPGYLDLCRLFTTADLKEWFGHIAQAAEELREEFDLMVASGATPREYGLRVQSHPTLLVTSPLKMRTARRLQLSFSGDNPQTVSLYRDPAVLAWNLGATERLLAAAGSPEIDPVRSRPTGQQTWTGFLWSAVPAEAVLAFLGDYRTHPEARRVNSSLLAEFIRAMNVKGELTSWSVGLMGGGEGREHTFLNRYRLRTLQRSGEWVDDERYSIGTLLSGRDESIDIDSSVWTVALEQTRSAWHEDPARQRSAAPPDAPAARVVRRVRGLGAEGVLPRPETGLLLLYPLDPALACAGLDEEGPPVIGFGLSLPASRSAVTVEYQVNNVLWEQQYGPAE